MADAEEKLVDHLKTLWADNISLHAKVEGFSLGTEGPTMLENHKAFKKIAKKIMWFNHKIGHSIRYVEETPPASIMRVSELTEIKDASEVPDIEEINQELLADFQTVLDRAIKAHKRAHDSDQFGIASILGRYIQALDHWIWHTKSTIANQKPEEI
jgi:DNA-binding ferritin-like protein